MSCAQPAVGCRAKNVMVRLGPWKVRVDSRQVKRIHPVED